MIKKFIINSCIGIVKSNYPEYDQDKLDRIQYGLESIYLSITKLVVILALSFILRILKETVIVLLLFNILRTIGFGLHATKTLFCWITSIPTFIGVPLVCKYVTIPHHLLIVIALISLLFLILFAPADTHKRPLIRKRRRRIYKSLTIATGIIYTLLVITIKEPFWQSAITFSMLIEAILICPLTYKLFNLPYNNYKKYTQ